MQEDSYITSRPFDAITKALLSDLNVAREFLEVHLDPEFKASCDLSSLQLTKHSFVDEHLKEYFTDVLFTVRLPGKDGYIYILIEHQSSPDHSMSKRFMQYQTQIKAVHFDNHGTIPHIHPILLYCGAKEYKQSCDLTDYLEHPELCSQILTPAYQLVNLRDITEEEIRKGSEKHQGVALLQIALRYAFARDLIQLAKSLCAIHWERRENLEKVLRYVTVFKEARDSEGFWKTFHKAGNTYKEAAMTLAQELEEKGEEKGLKKGIRKGMRAGIRRGREEGREEGERIGYTKSKFEIAKKLREQGVSLEFIQKVTGLTGRLDDFS